VTLIGRREYHAFEADGAQFVYLVPSAGVFRLDATAVAVLDALHEAPVAAAWRRDSPSPRCGPPAHHDGAERHEQVQPGVHVLLRIRRGPDCRPTGAKPRFLDEATAKSERGLHVRRVGQQSDREPHLFRWRDAAQLQGAAVRRWRTRASAARCSARREFSLTTNGTLLKPEIIDWLATRTSASPSRSTATEGDAGPLPRLPQRRGELRPDGSRR
jgi:hypothetical protein